MALSDTPTEEELSAMTKAQLQTYADENGISGVNSGSQTKSEMISAILAAY